MAILLKWFISDSISSLCEVLQCQSHFVELKNGLFYHPSPLEWEWDKNCPRCPEHLLFAKVCNKPRKVTGPGFRTVGRCRCFATHFQSIFISRPVASFKKRTRKSKQLLIHPLEKCVFLHNGIMQFETWAKNEEIRASVISFPLWAMRTLFQS